MKKNYCTPIFEKTDIIVELGIALTDMTFDSYVEEPETETEQ